MCVSLTSSPSQDNGDVDLPFAPPTSDEGHFLVPSGIRPTLQKTRIEVFYFIYTCTCAIVIALSPLGVVLGSA